MSRPLSFFLLLVSAALALPACGQSSDSLRQYYGERDEKRGGHHDDRGDDRHHDDGNRDDRCENAGMDCDPTSSHEPCGHGASCEQGSDGFFRCACDDDTSDDNTDEPHACVCPEGYEDLGEGCVDINECDSCTDVCGANEVCINTVGSYECECEEGFEDLGEGCVDIDECNSCPGHCNADETCVNTEGSYECQCSTGYANTGSGCEDINECAEGGVECPGGTICINEDPGYRCECPAGFVFDGELCVDIDECADASAACGESAICTNTEGGYECACDDGYAYVNGICEDIDECADGTSVCVGDQICVNEVPGHSCTCPEGYAVSSDGCEDIDECLDPATTCGDNAICANTEGSYACECETGYVDVAGSCEDVDECGQGIASCPEGATCTNTAGGYECECPSGTVLEGDACVAAGDDCPEGYLFRGGFCSPIVTDIAVGSSNACALKPDGTTRCWGYNGATVDYTQNPGDLTYMPTTPQVSLHGGGHVCSLDGDGLRTCATVAIGDSTIDPTPQQEFSDMCVGNSYACGIETDGDLFCWGTMRNVGQTVAAPYAPFGKISCGDQGMCVITADGSQVWCRGVGNGLQLSGTAGQFVDLATPAGFACVLNADSTITCFGNEAAYADLGIPTGPTDFVELHGYGPNFCGLRADGSVECWDYYRNGPPEDQDFVKIAVGKQDACGMRSDGTLSCWGGSTAYPTLPGPATKVTPVYSGGDICGINSEGEMICTGDFATFAPIGTFKDVAVTTASRHACAINSSDNLECWNPSAVEVPPAGTYETIIGSENLFCALSTDGEAVCWRASGGTDTTGVATPPSSTFVKVMVSQNHACGLDTSGQLVCWGTDNYGEADDTPWSETLLDMDTGWEATCGIRASNSTLICRGDNTYGQLNAPSGTFSEVAVGRFGACALRSDGTVACWGAVNPVFPDRLAAESFTNLRRYQQAYCGDAADGESICWGHWQRPRW